MPPSSPWLFDSPFVLLVFLGRLLMLLFFFFFLLMGKRTGERVTWDTAHFELQSLIWLLLPASLIFTGLVNVHLIFLPILLIIILYYYFLFWCILLDSACHTYSPNVNHCIMDILQVMFTCLSGPLEARKISVSVLFCCFLLYKMSISQHSTFGKCKLSICVNGQVSTLCYPNAFLLSLGFAWLPKEK